MGFYRQLFALFKDRTVYADINNCMINNVRRCIDKKEGPVEINHCVERGYPHKMKLLLTYLLNIISARPGQYHKKFPIWIYVCAFTIVYANKA